MADSAQRMGLQREQSATFEQFVSQWAVAMDAGLTAAAEVYVEGVVAKLAAGYTSGAFVGQSRRPVAETVRVSKPYTRDGVRHVNAGSNDPQTGWWEFGHQNLFTRRFERVEHFRNTVDETGPQMAKSFHDVFSAVLGAAA